MNTPSPDQQRKLKNAYESVNKYWYADLSTKELRRKPLSIKSSFINVFWKTRHTVWEFYWWISFRYLESDIQSFPYPIQSDNMPIKGFPIKYELMGNWSIPEKDLKYLIKGPLASEGLNEILVPAFLGWKKVLLYTRQFFAIVTAGIGVIGVGFRWWPELMALRDLIF